VDRREIPLEHARGRHVLHIGLGGAIEDQARIARFAASDLQRSLHGRLSLVAGELAGLDINAATVEAMQAQVPGRYIVGDIADSVTADAIGTRFEIILFLEVIQDVPDLRRALLNVKKMLNDDGELIVSACNAYCADRFAKMFFGYEAVHSEHICYFSYMTLKRLLHVSGFDVEAAYYTFIPRGESEKLSSKILFLLEKTACRFLPQFAEGILMIARPRS
jgi:SAM-dependent methyltransferase